MNRKNQFLRKLAFFMSVVMLIGMVPFSSFAASNGNGNNYLFKYGWDGTKTIKEKTGSATSGTAISDLKPADNDVNVSGYSWVWNPTIGTQKVTSVSAISANTYTATYTPNKYDAVFNWKKVDSTTNDTKTVKVDFGKAVPNEDVPKPTNLNDGSTFKGWDKDLSTLMTVEGLKFNATYNPPAAAKYQVRFYAGLEDATKLIEGATFSGVASGALASTLEDEVLALKDFDTQIAVPGYDFTGWAPDITDVLTITKNTDFYATYELTDEDDEDTETYHSVTFVYVNADGTEAKTVVEVLEGKDATAPKPPVRNDGWTFERWVGNFTNVTEDLTVTARYAPPVDDEEEPVYYPVTFVDWDGTPIETQAQQIIKGGSAVEPTQPTRDGWVFTGWDKGFINVQGPLTVKAQYKPNEATIKEVAEETLKGVENGEQITEQVIAQELDKLGIGELAVPSTSGGEIGNEEILASGESESIYEAYEAALVTAGQKKAAKPEKKSKKVVPNKTVGETANAPFGHEVQLVFDEPSEDDVATAERTITRLSNNGNRKFSNPVQVDIKLVDLSDDGKELPLTAPLIITVEIPQGISTDLPIRVLHFRSSTDTNPEVLVAWTDGGVCKFDARSLSTYAIVNMETVAAPVEDDDDDRDIDYSRVSSRRGSHDRRNNDSSEPRPSSSVAAAPAVAAPTWAVAFNTEAGAQSAAQVAIPAIPDHTNSVRTSISNAMVQDAVMKSAANVSSLRQADPAAGVFMEFNVQLDAVGATTAQNAFVAIEAAALKSLSTAGLGLIINTPVSYLKLDAAAINELCTLNKPSYVFSAKQVPVPFAAKQTAGANTFYEIKLIDLFGQKVTGFTLGGSMELGLVYESAESASPQAAYILNSSLTVIEDSTFDGSAVSWKNIFSGIFTVIDNTLAM